MSETATYQDDDFVYVDPETKSVVGKVEWDKNGLPKPLKYVPPEPKAAPIAPAPVAADKNAKPVVGAKDKPRRSFSRKFYPWGTYRSMKKVFKVEGKMKEPEPNRTLEEVMPKAISEPFWE